jgi:GTP-binding protein EngB required for normal cell division
MLELTFWGERLRLLDQADPLRFMPSCDIKVVLLIAKFDKLRLDAANHVSTHVPITERVACSYSVSRCAISSSMSSSSSVRSVNL